VDVLASQEFDGYTVVDVETTGLSPSTNDRVVELAVVYVSHRGEIQDRWSTLVNPRRDVGPTHIHGISATDVMGAPTFDEIAPYVLRALSGRILVAHNAPFDARFLASELVRSGVPLGALEVPALCTMQWSSWFLAASSRRLVDCCAACNIQLLTAHSASGDALATAQLLAHYLRAAEYRPPWDLARDSGSRFVWPTYRGDYTELHLVRRGTASQPRSANWLDSIMPRMPQAAEPRVNAYLNVLEMALLDGFLAEHEKAALVEVANEHGLSRGQVMDIHSDYLRALAGVALADGIVTPKERADLELVARLLSLPPSDVDTALDIARQASEKGSAQSAVTSFATTGITLKPGDRVAFTGAMQRERSEWEMAATTAGLRAGSLTKSTTLLVAADPNSQSGKAAKARAYGIPIINESGFANVLEAFMRDADDSGRSRSDDPAVSVL
jgi:DNA polymerase-3 subunit epsilon